MNYPGPSRQVNAACPICCRPNAINPGEAGGRATRFSTAGEAVIVFIFCREPMDFLQIRAAAFAKPQAADTIQSSLADDSTAPPIPQQARCISCGYSLYKLTADRCPECGKTYDVNDPRTMGLQRATPPVWLIRRIDRPTSRFTASLPFVATLLILYGTRLPTIYAAETLLGIVLWLAFLVGHMPIASIRYYWLKKNIIKPSSDRTHRPLLRRAIIGLVISLTLLYIPLPAFLIFWLYRPEFDKLANQSLSMPYFASEIFNARVGPYLIQRVDRCPHGIEFEIDLPYWSQQGYQYSERPKATFVLKNEPGECRNHAELDWHLAGEWYTGKPE